MLYHFYETSRAMVGPMAAMAEAARHLRRHPPFRIPLALPDRALTAMAELARDAIPRHARPDWRLDATRIDGATVAVRREIDRTHPFGDLLHFRRLTDRRAPRLLLVAPMSGHYATLLRGTVRALLPDHDVWITDWRDAALVPLGHGRFGVDDYIALLLDWIRFLGPDLHVVAVCQPAPLVLAAVSLLAAEADPAQPRSMTLMGGPVDTRAAPTAPTRLAESRSLDWFETRCITTLPAGFPAAHRRVYPGFLQLGAFIAMNADRHAQAHLRMFRHLIAGDGESAAAHRRFYDEYRSVMDVTAEYYLETVDRVFQRHLLPRGRLAWRGRPVEPARIRRTALMTVEGELDDISAPGQTASAHRLCAAIPEARRRHHLQAGVGHYGIFNGRRWREGIAPALRDFIREMERAG